MPSEYPRLDFDEDHLRELADLARAGDKRPPIVETVGEATPQVGTNADFIDNELQKKFIRLRDQWLAERGPHSSTHKLVIHPAYQTIIGMGQDAIPFILRELEKRPDVWFWALRAITEANPVRNADRGDGAAMAKAWLDWAEQNGYRW